MTATFPLRAATEADIPRLIEISLAEGPASRWTAKQWVDIFDSHSPHRLVLLAQSEAEPCAFLVALCNPAAGDCELENIAVLPQARRRGLARMLVEELLSRARQARSQRILLEVRPSNAAALALYQRCGFVELARRREYYSNPKEDALILVHSLECE